MWHLNSLKLTAGPWKWAISKGNSCSNHQFSGATRTWVSGRVRDFAGWTNGCGCMSHYWWIWKKLGVAELVHYQNKASKMYKCSKYRYIYYVYIDIYDIKILYMYIVAFGSWIPRLTSKSHCQFGAKKEQKKKQHCGGLFFRNCTA